MAKHGGDSGSDNIQKQPPAETFKLDLADYRGAERSHPGDVQSTGQRLQEAALAYEKTVQQTPMVHEMADAIKNGTPGTPEWDKLMDQVQAQLKANEQSITGLQQRTGQIPELIGQANTTDKHLPNPIINMNA